MRKMIFVFMLVVLGFSNALSTETSAATKTTSMYVNAKNDIVLRAKPSQNAERMGTIKNHSKLTVFSSSNGWSRVQAGKSKGFVYTSALSKKNPNAAPTSVNGGLSPVSGLTLTYEPSFMEDTKETFITRRDGKSTYLFNTSKKSPFSYAEFVYYEDKDRLMMGVAESDFIFVDAAFPLRQGKSFTGYNLEENYKVLVESTTKTIKVKAGSFRNVVILRYPNGSREYLAKGIGIIKSTDKNGKTYTELTAVKHKK
ncbi:MULTISPECIES: SH3 domain-containing protein [unclassified Sporosarcina]|uniref:SH3 domain-containing protein n=1 Tax=unclassified Sporosarcina TaxID=2647733 RepID=UPI0013040F29|nr:MULTISPECIES: SH3 domain-containing protein [unclassified Sporosarcina]